MSKSFRQNGRSIAITGVSSGTIPSGSLYRRTGYGSTGRAWIGVVEDDITGTSTARTTLDGRPIVIGDGVAAEAQYGTGKGDMTIEGVYTMRLPASGTNILDGAPLYASFTSNVASGVTDNVSGATFMGPISGAMVGYAVGANYVGTSAPYVGLNVVDVKLLGFPLHRLAEIAPATST